MSDSNNIILWHESEDINQKKSLFPKLIPILRLQVMHDYVWFIAPIYYCVEQKQSLVYKTFLFLFSTWYKDCTSAFIFIIEDQKQITKNHNKSYKKKMQQINIS